MISEVESTPNVLVSFFLLFKMLLEFIDAPLQVTVNLYVSGNDAFHPSNVLIDIVLDLAYTLHVGNEFSLFC